MSDLDEALLHEKIRALLSGLTAPHDDPAISERAEAIMFEQLKSFHAGSWHRHDIWQEHLRMDDDGGPPHV